MPDEDMASYTEIYNAQRQCVQNSFKSSLVKTELPTLAASGWQNREWGLHFQSR